MFDHPFARTLRTLDSETPALAGLQAQGDLLILPSTEPYGAIWTPVPATGIQLMQRVNSPNSHWLLRDPLSTGVAWMKGNLQQVVARLRVPQGERAFLLHTDDHHPLGIAPGVYVIHCKRKQAYERQRVEYVQD